MDPQNPTPQPPSKPVTPPQPEVDQPKGHLVINPPAENQAAKVTPADLPPEPVPTDDDQSKSGAANLGVTILKGLLNWIVVPVAIVLILHNFVFQAFHVVGTSMVPTLHETDYLIISKVGATDSQLVGLFGHNSPYVPKRQEIIVFHYPKDPSLIFVKRVIGLPGEHVVVSGGKVTVYNQTNPNGFDPDAGTVRAQTPTLGDIDEVVPAGEIFVLGDNRTPNGSYDSRDWGTLPYHYIIGDAVMRLLPVNQAGLL